MSKEQKPSDRINELYRTSTDSLDDCIIKFLDEQAEKAAKGDCLCYKSHTTNPISCGCYCHGEGEQSETAEYCTCTEYKPGMAIQVDDVNDPHCKKCKKPILLNQFYSIKGDEPKPATDDLCDQCKFPDQKGICSCKPKSIFGMNIKVDPYMKAGWKAENKDKPAECEHVSGGLGACPNCGSRYPLEQPKQGDSEVEELRQFIIALNKEAREVFDKDYAPPMELADKLIKAGYRKSPKHPESKLERLDFNKIWVEFERFLKPYTCDLQIKDDYARNAEHFSSWLKSVCEKYGTPKQVELPSEEEILHEIRMCTSTSGQFFGGQLAERIHKILQERTAR